ncbi:prepilin peptidase [Bacillus sp. ISL-4]|uniref:prepilin peptidase n=1 Tax=Bacillus sp. ISL-4 TaxID=2819125 RepID=UPI001BE6FF06|nr:A24 family peptidase [Bacillus sp. ISL-4]MBT2668150.1 prepilin peptidase [Bacillus sp. ISL-4]MBT2672046.1 prepilin peptidase [Streptomyces sp. ISL-14]
MMVIHIYLFVLGLILGSFFNVVGLSVPASHSFANRRSACPSCGRTLTFFELIPVISYMLQEGKCRGCKTRISPLYPAVEMLTGVLFTSAPIFLGWSNELLIGWTLISLFMIIFVTDVAYMLIPDKILLFFTVIFIVLRVSFPLSPWWDSIVGAAVGFSLLLLITVVSKGGMGGGDIKLFAVIGFVLGMKMVLLSFLFACFYGAFLGIIGLLTGILKKKTLFPFGPYIVFGTLTAYFWGDALLHWYVTFLR